MQGVIPTIRASEEMMIWGMANRGSEYNPVGNRMNELLNYKEVERCIRKEFIVIVHIE